MMHKFLSVVRPVLTLFYICKMAIDKKNGATDEMVRDGIMAIFWQTSMVLNMLEEFKDGYSQD